MSTAALAGEADVTEVVVMCDSQRSCRFEVTVRHADTGWEHYADHWRVLAPDGAELGRRVLHHPHVSEQPFTRSLSGVTIPAPLDSVTIEAHDSQHQYGGATLEIAIPP